MSQPVDKYSARFKFKDGEEGRFSLWSNYSEDEADFIDGCQNYFREGNGSCDCNRAIWLLVARGEEPQENHLCGEQLKIHDVIVITPDGREIKLTEEGEEI